VANLIIRPAVEADVSTIAAVQIAGWRQAYAGIIDPAYLANMRVDEKADNWRHTLGNRLFGEVWVAELDEQIRGFVAFGKPRADSDASVEIYALYVEPKFQNRTLGRALVRAVEATMQPDEIILEAWTAVKNPFVRFYEKMGGEVVGDKALLIGGKNYLTICFQWKRWVAKGRKSEEK
jgi:GNAT superfamily N-acetyltransferase